MFPWAHESASSGWSWGSLGEPLASPSAGIGRESLSSGPPGDAPPQGESQDPLPGRAVVSCLAQGADGDPGLILEPWPMWACGPPLAASASARIHRAQRGPSGGGRLPGHHFWGRHHLLGALGDTGGALQYAVPQATFWGPSQQSEAPTGARSPLFGEAPDWAAGPLCPAPCLRTRAMWGSARRARPAPARPSGRKDRGLMARATEQAVLTAGLSLSP